MTRCDDFTFGITVDSGLFQTNSAGRVYLFFFFFSGVSAAVPICLGLGFDGIAFVRGGSCGCGDLWRLLRAHRVVTRFWFLASFSSAAPVATQRAARANDPGLGSGAVRGKFKPKPNPVRR